MSDSAGIGTAHRSDEYFDVLGGAVGETEALMESEQRDSLSVDLPVDTQDTRSEDCIEVVSPRKESIERLREC